MTPTGIIRAQGGRRGWWLGGLVPVVAAAVVLAALAHAVRPLSRRQSWAEVQARPLPSVARGGLHYSRRTVALGDILLRMPVGWALGGRREPEVVRHGSGLAWVWRPYVRQVLYGPSVGAAGERIRVVLLHANRLHKVCPYKGISGRNTYEESFPAVVVRRDYGSWRAFRSAFPNDWAMWVDILRTSPALIPRCRLVWGGGLQRARLALKKSLVDNALGRRVWLTQWRGVRAIIFSAGHLGESIRAEWVIFRAKDGRFLGKVRAKVQSRRAGRSVALVDSLLSGARFVRARGWP